MKLDLDPESLRACMQLWRSTVDLAVPMQTEFALHFIQERPSILKNYERTAGAWLMLLRASTSSPEDKRAFEDLVAEIEAFQAWAKAELDALSVMAIQETIEAGIDELIATDPALAARLGRFLREHPPSAKKNPPLDDQGG